MNVRKKKPKPKKKTSLKERKIPQLKALERAAQDVLRNARRPLTTNEVAKYSGMSWQTAKKHLGGLNRKRRSIHKEKKGRTIFWFFKRG